MNKLLYILLLFLPFLSVSQVNQKDAKGQKQGVWNKKYPGSNSLIYKGQFKDDKPTGTFTYYYVSSKIKAVITYSGNSERAFAEYYHENGQIKKILLAKDDWEEFDENGKLINSYEISCLANYEKNYNIVHAQKLKYLRNSFGWNKLVIDLVEYRKNKHNFIVYNDGNYSYNPNVPFKIVGSFSLDLLK